jgi:hypothetical protein
VATLLFLFPPFGVDDDENDTTPMEEAKLWSLTAIVFCTRRLRLKQVLETVLPLSLASLHTNQRQVVQWHLLVASIAVSPWKRASR